jgi:hypothetical protein
MTEPQPRPKFVGKDGKFDNTAYKKWRYHNDPEYRAKNIETSVKNKQKKLAQDPEYYEKWQKKWSKYFLEKYHNDPEFKQNKLEYGRNYYHEHKEKEVKEQLQAVSELA